MSRRLRVAPGVILALVVLFSAVARGQSEPEIVRVQRLRDAQASGEEVAPAEGPVQIGLGDTLLVTVANWVVNETLEADRSEWQLKLDGIVLPSATAEAIDSETTPGQAEFRFFLTSGAGNREAWDALLRYPLRGPGWTKPVRVGIQPPSNFGSPIKPLASAAETELVVVSTKRFVPLAGFLVVVVGLLVVLGKRSNILRGPDGRSYSLGRTQMAWWFVIILGSYLFLGVLTFDWTSTIQNSALVLLGISATTALGSVIIDGDKRNKVEEARAQQKVLPELIEEMKQKVARADQPTDVAGLTSGLIELQAKLDKARAGARVDESPRKVFLMELISDSHGVSLHRFQNVIWTLVLGGVYALSVLTDLSMPEFNATLLSLMGISSGTYVAFKFPEKAQQSA